MINKSPATWQNLEQHATLLRKLHMRDFFATNPNRANELSLKVGGLLLDYSKNIIRADTLDLLFKLLDEVNFPQQRSAMFNGEKINTTENRAVLHTALRSQNNQKLLVDGINIKVLIADELKKMRDFSKQIRNRKLLGFSGKPITDIVNIGVGGSDLGPNMVCKALSEFRHPGINLHFMSNIDPAHFLTITSKLNPETVVFIITSKTFTTEETITNAHSAKQWFLQQSGSKIPQHFVAVTSNQTLAQDFGIKHIFNVWDWVGGRYSLWSAVGLIIMIAIGYNKFIELLKGADLMDQHFVQAPYHQNMPIIMALLSIWYNNFLNAESHAILPYDENLKLLTPYLKQVDMESNGKSVDIDGNLITQATASIIWGAQGINAQHAFYQLLHQSKRLIPADFIITAQPSTNLTHHHDILMANFIAQTEALMKGRTETETKTSLQSAGIDPEQVKARIPHMVFNGNNPSNSLVLDKLTPQSLGTLIAAYEHKIFVQGVIWRLNSYDQWGVELGKKLGQQILTELQTDLNTEHDGSTNNLIKIYRKSKNNLGT